MFFYPKYLKSLNHPKYLKNNINIINTKNYEPA